MKINEFINEMLVRNIATSNLITVRSYISSEAKIRLAKNVLDFSAEYDRGFIKFNSYKTHLAFIFEVIEAHTDLRFADNWSDKMQEYDVLCENDFLDEIINTFRKDYEASLVILDIMREDMLTDNAIETSIAKLATSITENLDVLVGVLSDKLENIDIEKIIPKDWDLNKLKRLLNKIK